MSDIRPTILALLVGRDDGIVQSYYGIWHEDKLWLVTAWLVDPNTQVGTPERMIRVDALAAKPRRCDPGAKFDYDGILLPRRVIEGLSQDSPGFEVRSLPDAPTVHRRDIKLLPQIFE